MKKNSKIATAAMALALCAGGQAVAQEGTAADDGRLLGSSWHGLRHDIEDWGLQFEGIYKADFLQVMDGGLEYGGLPMGHLDLRFTFDLDTIAGWADTSAFVNFLHNHGETLNTRRVGSLLGVSNIESPVDTYRVFQAWAQKEWLDGSLSVLAGLYPIDTEFQVIDSAAIFVQPPYGPTAELSLSRGPSIFNTSAVGLRARWLSESSGFYAQGAVLDGIAGDPDRPKGTHIVFDSNDGVMGIAELGLQRQPDDSNRGRAKFAIGGWGYSEKVDDLTDLDVDGNPSQRHSSGAYIFGERTLWRAANGAELHGFLRYSFTDGNSTSIEKTYSAGIFVTAPFSSRPEDEFGIGFTKADIGAKYQIQQEAAGTPARDYESAWEVTYRYAALPWLTVQPLVQVYRNPGAGSAASNATVAGTRIEFAF